MKHTSAILSHTLSHDGVDHIDIYTYGAERVRVRHLFCSLAESIASLPRTSPATVLIDDSLCHYSVEKIEADFWDPISVHDIDILVQYHATRHQMKHTITGELLSYYIDDVIIDGNPAIYILGQTGHISWKMCFFWAGAQTQHIYRLAQAHNPKTRIYPHSFFSILYANTLRTDPSYMMVTIGQYTTTCLRVTDGFYDTIQTLNRGVDHLRHIYTENHINDRRDVPQSQIDEHPLVAQTVSDAMTFFVRHLVQWLQTINQTAGSANIAIISPMTNMTIFWEILTSHYSQQSHGYIIPIKATSTMHTYHKTWTTDQIHVLTALQFIS